jgi:hypothetical protein
MKKSQSFALALFLFTARHQALLEWSDENKKTKSLRILSFSFSRWPKSVRCEAAIRPEVHASKRAPLGTKVTNALLVTFVLLDFPILSASSFEILHNPILPFCKGNL